MSDKKEQIKVLYLARWYPNRYDPMPGLFIQRHAEAAGRCCKVGVVYTHVVESEQIKGFEIDFRISNSIPTARVYYNNPSLNFPLITPAIKMFRFFRANVKGIQKVKDEMGSFDLLHIHILTRLGIIALWYKWFLKKPYLVSEHWSRYLPSTGDFSGLFRKWITRIVVKNASVVTTVTENLARAMQNHGLQNQNYRVLHNVVADEFLEFDTRRKKSSSGTTFVHVSCFEDKSKNISGLLHAVLALSKERKDFRFRLIGDGMDFQFLKNYAREIGLNEKTIEFCGLLEGDTLVSEMADADALVVFSNYENLPVVINESFAMGIPVISTNVGGISEIVNEQNGRLIEMGNEEALVEVLTAYLNGALSFNREELASKARSTFSPQAIGRELCAIYQGMVS